MHYNIELLPKKVTNYVTFMESNALRYFELLFKVVMFTVHVFFILTYYICSIQQNTVHRIRFPTMQFFHFH